MYLAYDISTSTIGEALMDENGKLLRLNHLKLKNRKDASSNHRLLEKAEVFKEYLIEKVMAFIKKFPGQEIKGIFIEEALITSSNPNTAAMLNKFNGMCSYNIYEVFKIMPQFITVHEARTLFCPELVTYKKGVPTLSFPKNIDKKEYLWKKVDKMENGNIEWEYDKNKKLKKENFDMSDAYVVGKAGIKKFL